jgi:Flp pilus assembly protein TadG
MACKRTGGKELGQAVVEMALLLPSLLLIILGILDLGRAVYMRTTLSGAVREGCRVAIVSTKTDTQIRLAVQNAAVGVTIPSGSITIAGSRASGGVVAVSATVIFHPLTPLITQIAGDSITLSASARMTVD